ncbi:protein kinase, partial [Elasticomyces elasticus]
MEIFKDPNARTQPRKPVVMRPDAVVNPRTGRPEQVAIDMDQIYPNEHEEWSFEELLAVRRGWYGMSWHRSTQAVIRDILEDRPSPPRVQKSKEPEDLENITFSMQHSTMTDDSTSQSQMQTQSSQPQIPSPRNEQAYLKPKKERKLKHREIKQETQTVKARLDSPSKPKIRRKVSAEPTMTMNSKMAQNEIYEMFNNTQEQLERSQDRDDTQSGQDTDFEADDTFSTAGESTQHTSRVDSTTNSDFDDETSQSLGFGGEDHTFSDLTTGKVSKILKKARSSAARKHKSVDSDDLTIGDMVESGEQTQNDGFDTQAINAIANADFSDLDTLAIAKLAGEDVQEEEIEQKECEQDENDLITPTERSQPHFQNYEPTPLRPYRDSQHAAQNRLPFMTPIVEQTESSLAAGTIYQKQFQSTTKTPSRTKHDSAYNSPSKNLADLLLDSPKSGRSSRKRSIDHTADEEQENDADSPPKKQALEAEDDNVIPFPIFTVRKDPSPAKDTSRATSRDSIDIFKVPAIPPRPKPQPTYAKPVHKGPMITDIQVNPCSTDIINTILTTIHPAPSSYSGYHANVFTDFNHFSSIRAYAKQISKLSVKSSPRKSGSVSKIQPIAPSLHFADTNKVYVIKKELGEGAFAPVYLAESHPTATDKNDPSEPGSELVAIKAEATQRSHQTLPW